MFACKSLLTSPILMPESRQLRTADELSFPRTRAKQQIALQALTLRLTASPKWDFVYLPAHLTTDA